MRIRFFTLICICMITPLGFYTKFYQGLGADWVNNSLGGVLYVIFWCLVVFLIYPKGKPLPIALSVLAVTSILEILQLWHPAFLEICRKTFLGQTILGNSFCGDDFLYYIVGALAGWLWLRKLKYLQITYGHNSDTN